MQTANIFFPESALSVDSCNGGILIGYNFEGFIFVIVDVIPFSTLSPSSNQTGSKPQNSIKNLHHMINQAEFTSFEWHCAGELLILGVLEPATQSANLNSPNPQTAQPMKASLISPSKSDLKDELLKFKQDQNIWLNINLDQNGDNKLKLKDLIVCEYKYTTVMANFIAFPRLEEGQLLSTTAIHYDELLLQSKTWAKRIHKKRASTNKIEQEKKQTANLNLQGLSEDSMGCGLINNNVNKENTYGGITSSGNFDDVGPIIKDNILTMVQDLTDNDLVLRQINAAHIIRRILRSRLAMNGQKDEDIHTLTTHDYYGDSQYWLRSNFVMKVVLSIFLFLCVTQKIAIKAMLKICGFFPQGILPIMKHNFVIQLKKKCSQFEKVKIHLQRHLNQGKSPNQNPPLDKDLPLLDQHLYKQACYVKFNSLITQIVIDFLLGIGLMSLMLLFPDWMFKFANYFTYRLHLDHLIKNIEWLMVQPAGFKPNQELSHFLGISIFHMIDAVNHITAFLSLHHVVLIHLTGGLGLMGFTVLLAIIHDILFLCSFWVFALYAIFAKFYQSSISMLQTQSNLFRGRKYNVLRERQDSNQFTLTEFYFGVTVVCISLFLLPTFASFYYYCFLSVILNVLVLQIVLLFLQIVSVHFPFFLLGWVCNNKYSLPNQIRIEFHFAGEDNLVRDMFYNTQNQKQGGNKEVAGRKGVSACDMAIVAKPMSIGPLFSRMKRECVSIFDSNKSLPKEIFWCILGGKNCFYYMRDFLNILAKQFEDSQAQLNEQKSTNKQTQENNSNCKTPIAHMMNQTEFLREIIRLIVF